MLHTQTTIEFQTQAIDEDGFRVSSPPLWRNIRSGSRKNGPHSSPLLPHNHYYSNNTSPTWRTCAIAQGRRELMEMVQNMPESCFELSLKDMVEEHHILQGDPPAVEDDVTSNFETEAERIKTCKKKINQKNRKGQMMRAASMDNEVFQIKMFVPNSLGPKKKGAVNSSSRVSPRRLFQQSENNTSKDGWMRRFFVVKEVENTASDSISSSSSNSSNSSRDGSGSLFPSCWPFFKTKNSKTRQSQGCIF